MRVARGFGRTLLYPGSAGRALTVYLTVFALLAAAFAWGVSTRHRKELRPGQGAEFSLPSRMAWYGQHKSDYDLVFIGDSRTYCGIHPEVIDPILESRSINLSSFAHWFGSQYPQILDLAATVPKTATVVWSIGHANFFGNTGIQRKYPISPMLAVEYLAWGVPSEGLWDDVFYFIPGLQPLALRSNWNRRFKNWLNRALKLPGLIGGAQAAPPMPAEPVFYSAPDQAATEAQRWLDQFRTDGRVSSAMLAIDNGRANSVIAHMKGGGYYRMELVPDYFRAKQRENVAPRIDDNLARTMVLPEPLPGFWKLFERSLDAFKAAGVRLIVNEMEEAPYTYTNPLYRERWRRFMRERIQPRVEAAGFVYVRADFDRLDDADYFDYNHLNSRGIHKYAAMLGELLRPHLAPTLVTAK